MSSWRRAMGLLTLAALSFALLTPAGTPAQTKPASSEPLKIGFITALSGPAKLAGEMQKIAMDMALEKINSQGGINGHPVQLVTEDAQLAPPTAVTSVRKLAEQDRVLAIVGPISSGQWEVSAPLVNEVKIVATTANATKSNITKPPWAFRLVGVDMELAPVGMKGVRQKHPNVKRVVVVGDVREAASEYNVNTSYPQALKENGFEIVDTIGFPTGTTDFAPIVTRIKSRNPEALVMSLFLAEGLAIAKELERQAVNVPTFVGPVVWALPFAPLATPNTNGWLTVGYYDVSPQSARADVRDFYKEYVRRAEAIRGIPKPVNVTNNPIPHDVLMLYAEIIRKGGITPSTPLEEARTKIRDGMRAMKNFQGIGALYRDFKADGDVNMEIYPLILENKQWVRLK
jgi:branched-chain amino acid transport system substrate-binding protein